MSFRKTTAQFQEYLTMHKKGVILVQKHMEARGHRIIVRGHAKSTEVFTDPALKGLYAQDCDLYDVCHVQPIEVKTTKMGEFWVDMKRTLAQIDAEQWWVFWEAEEIRSIAGRDLYLLAQKGTKVITNRYGEVRVLVPRTEGHLEGTF